MDFDIDVGTGGDEIAQARQQPSGGKGRDGADVEPLVAVGADFTAGIFDLGECRLNPRRKPAALSGKGKPAPHLLEERDTQIHLQGADLMADGTVCQVERFSGARHAAVTGNRNKNTQGVKGGHAVRHV